MEKHVSKSDVFKKESLITLKNKKKELLVFMFLIWITILYLKMTN